MLLAMLPSGNVRKSSASPLGFTSPMVPSLLEIDNVQIARLIKCRSLNIIGKNIFLCKILRYKKTAQILSMDLCTNQGSYEIVKRRI